jgi:hypothetical protein
MAVAGAPHGSPGIFVATEVAAAMDPRLQRIVVHCNHGILAEVSGGETSLASSSGAGLPRRAIPMRTEVSLGWWSLHQEGVESGKRGPQRREIG